MREIIGMVLFMVFFFEGISFFVESVNDKLIIDAATVSLVFLMSIPLTFCVVFGLPSIYCYWREPVCPWCGSRKQGTFFGQLSSGEKICGFCQHHYWHQGWRNLSSNPATIPRQLVWFLLPFWGSRGIVIVVSILFSGLLILLGSLTQLLILSVLGKEIGYGILVVIVVLVFWQFVKIKWLQTILRWQVEVGVVDIGKNKISLKIFRQNDKNDPRDYFLGIVLGLIEDNRWGDIAVAKDIVTGDYKKFLIHN